MNSNDFFSFRNSISAALRASKRAKLRRAGFGLKARKVPFCRDSYNFFFLGELLFKQGAAKTEPSPRRPHKPISALCISCHSLQDDNTIHPLQLGLRAPASPPSPLVTVVTASLAKADNKFPFSHT